MHKTAQSGYSKSDLNYDDGRPEYPKTAIDFLVGQLQLGANAAVLDLAAGTGKLSKCLQDFFPSFVALEPLDAMRAQLQKNLPEIKAASGSAEKIPFPNASFDAVFVGTAFHWFRAEDAYQEIHRVLKPGGGLALIWSAWSKTEIPDWLAEIRSIIEPLGKGVPRYKTMEWKSPFGKMRLFSELKNKNFDYPVSCTREQICARYLSTSFIAALDAAEKSNLRAEIMAILGKYESADGKKHFRVPYQIDAYWCTKN